MYGAKVINSDFDVTTSDFDANSMEENTTRADGVPDIGKVEIGDDFDPKFSWKGRDSTSYFSSQILFI